MTEGDEAGDVGVARVFCGLAKLNQHLDHVFVEATEGFDNQGKKHATLFLHLRVVLDDLAVGAVKRSVTRDRGGLGVSIRRGKQSAQQTKQWRVLLPCEGARSRRRVVFHRPGCAR